GADAVALRLLEAEAIAVEAQRPVEVGHADAEVGEGVHRPYGTLTGGVNPRLSRTSTSPTGWSSTTSSPAMHWRSTPRTGTSSTRGSRPTPTSPTRPRAA